MTPRSGPLRPAIRGIRSRVAHVSHAARPWFPPIHRREFWLTQCFVVAVAAIDAAVETTGLLEAVGPAYVFSVAFVFVPVLYAAVTFGVRGSLPTAIWSAVVMLPDLIIHSGSSSRLGEIWELGIVVVLSVFVGSRVDREIRARTEAEGREQERLASEQRYRSLFDGAPTAIFITDAQGVVQELNETALALVGERADTLSGRALAAFVGDEIAGMVLGREEPRVVALESKQFGKVWLLPVTTPYRGVDGHPWIQAILRDVTTLEERKRGIEAYARRTVAGREEERRRIARELHDGPLQSVIMLSRRLTAIEPPASPEGRRDLEEVHTLALSVAGELRRTSRNLRPSILDDLGLVAALRSEGDLVAGQHAIAVQFKLTGTPMPLAAATELMLLRVTQEAVRNVVRHAAASNLLIALSHRPASVKLSIADDGRGLGRQVPTEDLLAAGKLGIVGMTERARLLGATCRIRAKRHGGTIVEVIASGPSAQQRPPYARPPQVKKHNVHGSAVGEL